ncbi:L-threonylcarbamoyladenylate synthase [Lysinibacillus sp. FSL K6-0232]|uniref:L-threonylcarbamoyladenylate synthase n=1 Tax=unclassified Lysinibacillus TaxID=2636778 RepID=UPI0030FA4F2B
MKTVCKVVDSNVNSQTNYTQAVDILHAGEVVAFPTETVYGLGAIATNDSAVKKIFEAKGRPSDNPLIVHIGTKEEVTLYVTHISEVAKQCMELFWPGPLTLIMPVKPNVLARSVTAGLSTVGIRMPNHPVALALLQQLQQPLAAPSANRSGKPSPTEAVHVKDDLDGYIPYILDGGSTGIGLESTVLDVTQEPPVILRPGGITKEMLEANIGPVIQPTKLEQKLEETPKAPGMKYTHYAPNAPVLLIDCDKNVVSNAVQHLQREGHIVALLAPASFHTVNVDFYFSVGEAGSQEEMGATLYNALRACDKTTATIILATATSTEGVGAAIMNRLDKAAGGKWYSH